jgi:uncharacterized protein (TIGR01777 family)
MKIIIAGSSGFIGSHLVSFLEKRGHQLLLLSRDPSKTPHWEPDEEQLDPMPLEGADVVINLCGENIFGRWNKAKKDKIYSSRVHTTHFFCSQLLALKKPPNLYIGASAIGYYGDRKEEMLTEESGEGKDFLSQVCSEWERAATVLSAQNIRVVTSRFGIVLGSHGGALRYMEKAFRMGMGGYLGSGKQMMSWIAIDDLCAAMQHVIDHQELAGPVNFTAPQVVSNQEFSQTLGKLLNRPTMMPVPKFALSMLFGEGDEIFLSSTHVSPKRLLETGFQFQYPLLEQALKHYIIST